MTDSIELARQVLKDTARPYSRRRDVNPYVALLDEVKWRAGHVAALRDLIGMDRHGVDDSGLGIGMLFTRNSQGDVVDSPLLRRYDKERTLLDRACKLAIDAGVAERYVKLAEAEGQLLFQVVQRAINDPLVALSDDQRAALGPALRRAWDDVERERAAVADVIDVGLG